MNNTLRKLEKELRSYAKRVKGVTYTSAFLISFLLTGMISLSATTQTDKAISQTKNDIVDTTVQIRQAFINAKRDNDRLIKNSNLELIKLMEQGDQVVKSPWSSWQFGVNTFIGSNKGRYSGRGDKKEDRIYKRLNTKEKYLQNFSKTMYKSGNTILTLENAFEPEREVSTTVSIDVKIPKVSGPSKSPEGPTGGIPSFNPITAKAPQAPEVKKPDEITIEPLIFNSLGANPENSTYSWWNQNYGDISQISMETGTFYKKSNEISVKDYYGKAAPRGGGSLELASPTLGGSADPTTVNTPNTEYRLKDGTYNNSNRFFLTLLKTPYSYFGENFRISANHGGAVINLETEGNVDVTTDQLKEKGFIDEAINERLKSYRAKLDTATTTETGTGTPIPNNPQKQSSIYFNNRGLVELGGKNTKFILTTTHTYGDKRVNLIENSGRIVVMNDGVEKSASERNLVFYHSPDTSEQTSTVYINTGKVDLYAKNGVGTVFTSSNLRYTDVHMINDGEINVYGQGGVGFGINNQAILRTGSGFTYNKPVRQFGDKTVGFYLKNTAVNKAELGIARTVIGEKNNIVEYSYLKEDGTTEVQKADSNMTGGDENWVENAVGVATQVSGDVLTTISAPQIDIEKYSKKGVGIYTLESPIKVEKVGTTNNNININGGEGNIALYSKGGEIEFNGDITMGGSALTTEGGNAVGKGNIGIFATNGKKVTLNGNLKTYNDAGESKDAIGVFAEGTTVDLNGSNDIKSGVGETGNSIGIYASGTGGIVNIAKPNETKISIDGTGKDLGTALFAGNGGVINANGTAADQGVTINIKNGASAVASMGANSKVNIQHSKISYTGKGYALYTSDDGKIDAQNSEITLDGNAVGFSIKGNGAGTYTSDVNLTGAKFKINSNNVILAGFTNGSSLQLSNFYNTLIGASGLDFNNISGTATTYKIGVIDGLNGANSFTLDEKLDKKVAATNKDSNSAKYVRNFLVQKSRLEVNKDVSAVISSADANVLGVSYVNGLDLSSNNGAASNNETIMNVNGVNVTADRTDAGAGAVGLYINYGKLNIAAGTKVDVETGNNVVNDSAIGVFALNGSEVDNKADITVKGNKSIGIAGMTYRENEGVTIVDEYGATGVGQGTISVKNTGNIKLDGKEAVGIFIKNNKDVDTSSVVADAKAENAEGGTIELTGNESTGMYAEGGTIKNAGNIKLTGTENTFGLFGDKNSSIINDVTGVIEIESSSSKNSPNVGILNRSSVETVINNGQINMKDNSFGIIAKNVSLGGSSVLKLGKEGVGIYSKSSTGTPSTLSFAAGSKIELESTTQDRPGVGVFTEGTDATTITADGNMILGDNNYGIISKTPGSITTGAGSNVTLGENTMYVVSENGASITNNTTLTSDKNNVKALYAKAGTITNNADINLSGIGSIGIISDGGTATNTAGKIINVGKSDALNEKYSVGMAAINGSTITNSGIINVKEESGIGMYATGVGSKAINANTGVIELSGKNSKGIYVTDGAVAENYGVITTSATNTADGIVGVSVNKNAIFKNYGRVIINGKDNVGVLFGKASPDQSDLYATNVTTGIKGTVTSTNGKEMDVKKQLPTEKTLGNIEIQTKPTYPETKVVLKKPDGTIKELPITKVDLSSTDETKVVETLNRNKKEVEIKSAGNFDSDSKVIKELGMYIDTSGIKHTNPYEGLNTLTALNRVNLLFGPEASRYTNSKVLEIGKNILKPYNDIVTSITNSNMKFVLGSASLTWFASGQQNETDEFEKVIMVKIPYTNFALKNDKNNYNFLDGLEQRYGVEGLNSREKIIFNKLNDLNKGEAQILTQAVDEMKGHQYANTQMRIKNTGDQLSKEFEYLMTDWYNPSKQNNKIKVFGMKSDFNTDTAGIKDFESNSYGMAYVHEDETIKLGENSGWYAGAIYNRFRFKDIGKSVEDQNMLKLGMFKTRTYDNNGSLKWKTSVDGFVGMNDMERQYLVVDEIFGAKSRYYTYGIGVKNEVSKDYRLSEHVSLVPYGSLNVEYGRFTTIKEKKGEMRLEVKGNHYISVKPEVGAELKFNKKINSEFKLTLSAGLAYELELGKVYEANNKARVNYTNADWYNLANEKENRTGNLKGDLKFGLEKNRFGLTLNVGYDTKGNNLRGGLGVRSIF